ncbi:MAG: selenoneine biosynthesis selenosugar synthase SenB [Betaproteobacteria bacterium]
MARLFIVTPAGTGTRNGNRHTALRWATLLRQKGHRVRVALEWQGEPCDALIALHARRSHASVVAFRKNSPKPLIVVLTGTDLYKDLPASSAEARESLALADRLIVLQDAALAELPPAARRKARVVYQSADPGARHAPPRDRFRAVVVGHLRGEKDPFRAAAALSLIDDAGIEVVQIGIALEESFRAEAEKRMSEEPRYRWLGGMPHARALGWMARSHLLVVSSLMEGGANVVAEAARIGTPVLASRMPGNIGMLGRGYAGYFPVGDEAALARLLGRAMSDKAFYGRLKSGLQARRALFAPAAERAALSRVLHEVLR